MSLPDNNSPWPPLQMAPFYQEMRTDHAWYSGDRTLLARVYQRDEQREDGSRRLWSRLRAPVPGERDRRMHIPLAADIAHTSAALLFSEPPTATVTNSPTQQRLDKLIEAGGVANTLLEAAEVGAALGGVYLRVTWDRDLVARPLLTVVHAHRAVPEFRFGILAAVTFWHELPCEDSGTVWRHVERHEAGRIVHGLYQGTPDHVGIRVPLTERPETAPLAASLGPAGDTIETGIPALTAAYVPNMKPHRLHLESPHGRSDYAAPLYDMLDEIDEVWSSWMRDIRLARARLIVPDAYLRDRGPGRGASFDADREIWQALNVPPTEQGGITLAQFAIRVDEHRQTSEALTQQAVRSAGYSVQSFGLGDQGAAVTATEVTARERRSMITRDTKSRYWAPALADMLHVMLMLDQALFTPGLAPERPRLVFGDSVSEDPQSVAQTLSLLQQAQAVSVETKVRILHPDWDDTAVREETDRILTESGQAVPDPMQSGHLL
ncbi:phage portal protein [Streptomyces sp. NPDC090442]|uniref:phage portal protein n=1 Tax=Streptomyces sp. NPDC090442 TaxID=3365962 RepID=UPI0037F2B741